MHGYAVGLAIEGCQEADNLIFLLLLQKVEAPGAVFTATPGKQDSFHCSHLALGISADRTDSPFSTFAMWHEEKLQRNFAHRRRKTKC
jgi:hypothetical protein